MTFELRVHYQADDLDQIETLDEPIVSAVGEGPSGGGCGVGCANHGNRDLQWDFDTFDAAVAAKDAATQVGHVRAAYVKET